MEVRLVDGDPRHMSCRQQVSLRDQRTGRTVKADRAEYDLAAGVTTFFGDPVELTDREGGRLHGRQLIYRLEDGRVHILSEAPEAGEGR
jgi:lipopolysaccharide export system protein LptA